MSLNANPLQRSLGERIGHALAFELIALLICAPALAWLLGKPLLQLGLLTLMFSTVAMLWNMLFNWLFDRAQQRLGFRRDLRVRLCHALLFETGLIVVLVPLAAWWLSIGLLEALSRRMGCDVSLSAVMGPLLERDARALQLEHHLPGVPAPYRTQDANEACVMELLETGRSADSAYDTRHSPVASYLVKSLGMPAVLPPPEEVKNVETAIGASRAEQQRTAML